MQSVPDLNFSGHFGMMVKTAVTDDSVLTTRHNGELRRHSGAIPAHDLLDKIDRLLSFSENA